MCNHQFVLIQQKEKFKEGTARIDQIGAQCGCILCGEVRIVWEDGQLGITVIGKQASAGIGLSMNPQIPKYPDPYVQPNTTAPNTSC